MLTMLITKDAIALAHRALVRRLQKGAKRYPLHIGYPGDSEVDVACWRSGDRIWFVDQPDRLPNRTWLAFGTTEPGSQTAAHSITCEINVPTKGANRRVAGAFGSDHTGRLFLTHSGQINVTGGGGGKARFLPWCGYDKISLYCPIDGRASEVVVIGALDSSELPSQVAHFVRQVEEFKKLAKSGVLAIDVQQQDRFKPEFEGARQPYEPSEQIVATCRHGSVINDLATALAQAGLSPQNDRRDLYLTDEHKHMVALFEAKVDHQPESIYCGIGQLLYYSAVVQASPTRVLVTPRLRAETRSTLRSLGFEVLEYQWVAGRPRYLGLDRLIEQLRREGAR